MPYFRVCLMPVGNYALNHVDRDHIRELLTDAKDLSPHSVARGVLLDPRDPKCIDEEGIRLPPSMLLAVFGTPYINLPVSADFVHPSCKHCRCAQGDLYSFYLSEAIGRRLLNREETEKKVLMAIANALGTGIESIPAPRVAKDVTEFYKSAERLLRSVRPTSR